MMAEQTSDQVKAERDALLAFVQLVAGGDIHYSAEASAAAKLLRRLGHKVESK